MVTRMPPIGEPLVLRDDDGLEYRSRAEDVREGTLTIARPTDLAAGITYAEGLAVQVTWRRDAGVHVLPVQLVSTYTEGALRLWELAVTGDSWTEQRRDYVRVPVSGMVMLTPDSPTPGPGARDGSAGRSDAGKGDVADGGGEQIAAAQADLPRLFEGNLVDVSEVALQCSVTVSPDDPRIAIGSVLNLKFAIGEDDFDIMGSVLIVRIQPHSRDTRLVLRFAESDVISDALRQHIFRIQLALRRQSRA